MVDKTGVAAGASGIACGVVRNNYFQPAMQELMAACVEIWESDPETLRLPRLGLHRARPTAPGGRPGHGLRAPPADRLRVRADHGRGRVAAHMRALFPDWRAPGLSVCLHERRGGFAFNRESMLGPRREGARRRRRDRGGRRGHGLRARRLRRRDTRVQTSAGRDRRRAGRRRRRPLDAAAVGDARAAGRLEVTSRRRQDPMWTYWYLQEGEIDVDPSVFVTADGSLPRCCTSTPTRRCTPTTARW